MRFSALLKSVGCVQMVLVTDPPLAMHILNSPHFDKFGFAYSFLDPVPPPPYLLLARPTFWTPAEGDIRGSPLQPVCEHSSFVHLLSSACVILSVIYPYMMMSFLCCDHCDFCL